MGFYCIFYLLFFFSASQGYAGDVGTQAHLQLQQLQVPVSITEHNSALNPTYQGTPTQQPKNNPKLTTGSIKLMRVELSPTTK